MIRDEKKIQLKLFTQLVRRDIDQLQANVSENTGILLLYNISQRVTFDNISNLIHNIKESTDSNNIVFPLVGNM